MNDTLIKVEDLCKIYNPGENEVRALDHVSLEIKKENWWQSSGNQVPASQLYEYAWVSRCAYLGKVLSERD